MYKITRAEIPTSDEFSSPHNWPLKVTVEATNDTADPNVFVYHVGEPDGTGLRGGDTFSNVASKQDMNVIPVGEPMEVEDALMEKDTYIPYYRTNVVELDCYNVIELERVWNIIQFDIQQLVREYRSWDKLQNGQEEIIEI